MRGPPSSTWRGEACDDGKQGSPGRAPLPAPSGPLKRDRARTRRWARRYTRVRRFQRIFERGCNNRARRRGRRLLRWNPDADANARRTGSKDVVDQLALPRALHPTLAALPPPARTVRTTADASARHAGVRGIIDSQA